MTKSIELGILGCGTVGSGFVELVKRYQNKNKSPKIIISKILVKSHQRAQEIAANLNLDLNLFTTNPQDIVLNPNIDIVVEMMGGLEQTKAILLDAINNRKYIVTANKDLLALEGEDLFEAAKQQSVTILYEAAVAGGIPIISTLKQSLQANQIQSLIGIINGTTNYILDLMKNQSKSFDQALKCAQEEGFAESDPRNDIEGHDAAYKIAILASIISEQRIDVKKIYREGINKITLADIKSAEKRGFVIKLLGLIKNDLDALDIRVHPAFVSLSNPLASVHLENNAILITADAAKELTLIGKGAGSLPTASSVFADVLILSSQLAQGSKPSPQFLCKHNSYAKLKVFDEIKNSFYVRVSMLDKVGVLKDLGEITSKHGANVKFIDQYDVSGNEAHADFIVDPISEKTAKQMVQDIEALDSIKSVESLIRVL